MSVPVAIFLGFLAGIAVSSVGLAWFARWVRRRIDGLTAEPYIVTVPDSLTESQRRDIVTQWDEIFRYTGRRAIVHNESVRVLRPGPVNPDDFDADGWVADSPRPVDDLDPRLTGDAQRRQPRDDSTGPEPHEQERRERAESDPILWRQFYDSQNSRTRAGFRRWIDDRLVQLYSQIESLVSQTPMIANSSGSLSAPGVTRGLFPSIRPTRS